MAIGDPLRDIIERICMCIEPILGADWKAIQYLEELEKNNALCQDKSYGIRALEATEVEGVTKFVTLDQTFELVLVRSKLTKSTGDSDLLELSYDNRNAVLCAYKDLARTRIGGANVLLVNSLTISEPEFIEDGKVVVQRAQFNVKYRCEI